MKVNKSLSLTSLTDDYALYNMLAGYHTILRTPPFYLPQLKQDILNIIIHKILAGNAYQAGNALWKYSGEDKSNFRGISRACLSALEKSSSVLELEKIRIKDHFWPRQVSVTLILGIEKRSVGVGKITYWYVDPLHTFPSFEEFSSWLSRARQVYWVTPEENKRVQKFQKRINYSMLPGHYLEIGINIVTLEQRSDLVDYVFSLIERKRKINELSRNSKEEVKKVTKSGTAIKNGLRLFNLAGRPTVEQLTLVYGSRGPEMTWKERENSVPAEKFQETLAAKIKKEKV
jgi:hypothetical protein